MFRPVLLLVLLTSAALLYLHLRYQPVLPRFSDTFSATNGTNGTYEEQNAGPASTGFDSATPGFIHREQLPSLAASACRRAPVGDVTVKSRGNIYAWTDDQGQHHFSDTPPDDKVAIEYDTGLADELEYFTLHISDTTNASLRKDQIEIYIRRIYQELAGFLDATRVRKIMLNVLMLPDRQAYLNYYASSTGSSGSHTDGFFNPASNQLALYHHEAASDTMRVLNHEAVHAILFGLTGNIPRWLTEGLAEYFEVLQLAAQYARVDPNQQWLSNMQQQSLAGFTLETLFNSPQDWPPAQQQTLYGASWALTYFLMSEPSGKSLLGQMLIDSSNDYCNRIDSSALVNTYYNVGMEQLEADFQRWLLNRNRKSAHYL